MRPYDLILLDQRMPPGLSGIEVAEQLRGEGRRPRSSSTPPSWTRAWRPRLTSSGLRTVDKGEPDRLMDAVRRTLF